MQEYLDIGQKEQSRLIYRLKQQSKNTWDLIAKELGVSRSMIYFYRSGKSRIPVTRLAQFAQLAGCSIRRDYKTIFCKYRGQNPVLPKNSPELAEFLGILYGDGCLWTKNYTLSISGDSKLDLPYHKTRVAPLIKKLFELEPRFKFEKHANEMHTLVSSKKVHHFLHRIGFPIGRKKEIWGFRPLC